MKVSIINSNEVFSRIKSGRPFSSDLKPYSKIEIASVIKILEKEEEYEKCHLLHEWYKVRFKHEYNYFL